MTHQRTFLLRYPHTDADNLLLRVLHDNFVPSEQGRGDLEYVHHGQVAPDAHPVADAEGRQVPLVVLRLGPEEPLGLEDVVVGAPEGCIVVHDVVLAEYGCLNAYGRNE